MILVSYLRVARRLLWSAPVTWERAIDRMAEPMRIEIARTLNVIAVQAARVAEYVEARAYGADHRAAVRASNARVRKVRRALGYTYSNQDLTF